MYVIECENGHRTELDPCQLESLIADEEFDCEQCGGELGIDQGEACLQCHVCDDEFYPGGLQDAVNIIDDGCYACQNRGFDGCSIRVRDSFGYWSASYEWMRSGIDGTPLARRGRSDYWEGVAHFCSGSEFASISRDGRIRASPTGYFRVPAVCLSEAPRSGWGELQKRHGGFGFVFRKRDIIGIGGGPALYLSEQRIKAQSWHRDLEPLVNLLRIPSHSPGRRKLDFLHEREWRTPADIVFSETQPFAVFVGSFGPSTPGWRDVFRALMAYEELELPSSDDVDP